MATNEIEKHIDTLAILGRAKWGKLHVLTEIEDEAIDHSRCTKCGIEYVAYPFDSIMRTECELWKKKLLKLINEYK